MADELITCGLVQIQLDGKGIDEAVVLMQKIVANAKKGADAVEGIGAAAKHAGTASKEAADHVGYLGRQFEDLQRRVIAGLGVIELGRFAKESFLEFAKLERGLNVTRQLVHDIGGAAGASYPEVHRFLHELGEQTGQLNSALIPAFNRLLLSFNNVKASQEALTIAARFAEAGFGDLESNATALATAFQTGVFRSLSQFGIQTKDASGKAIDFAKAIELIEAKSKTLSKTDKDAQDRLGGWARVWEAFKEQSGSAIDFVLKKYDQLAAAKQRNDDFFRERFLRDTVSKSKLVIQDEPEDSATAAATAAMRFRKEKGEDSLSEVAKKRAAELAKAETDARLKEAQELAAKIRDLEEKAAQDLLRQRIAFEEQGSQARLDIELKLNARLEAEAIRNAQAIGAKTADIAKFFAGERGRIAASKGESAAAKSARETAAGFDPRAGFAEVEAFAEEHEDKLTKIADEGTVARLKSIRDLTIDGTQERLDAEAELLRAELQAKSDAAIAAAKKDKALITAIRQAQANEEHAIDIQVAKWKEELRRMELQSNLQATQSIAGALGGLFSKHQGFAIGTAIVDTALAVSAVWAQGPQVSIYQKIAETIVATANGLAQIASIKSATVSGGGSVASASGGRAAAAPTSAPSPTFQQSGGTGQAPPSFTQGLSVAPVSPAVMSAVAGMSSVGGSSTVINIRQAFGDKRSMTKLAREITRVVNNDSSRLR